MQIILAILVTLLLAGCLGLNEPDKPGIGENFMSKEEINAKDDAICRGYGAKPGEQVYIQCRIAQDQRRDGVENAPIYPPPGQVRRY